MPNKSIQFIWKVVTWLEKCDDTVKQFFLLALMNSLEEISFIRKHGAHYRFMNGNNVGIKQKIDFDKIDPLSTFERKLSDMVSDLKSFNYQPDSCPEIRNTVVNDSIFELSFRKESGFTHVITSPPYLNRDNYIAQQKIEMFVFKLSSSFEEYRELTKRTLRSHVEAEKQHGYKYSNPYIEKILEKLSGQELSYPTIPDMIFGYFEDLYATLKIIKDKAVTSCKYCFVVGNSRWAGVVVPVDTMLLAVAEDLEMTPSKIFVTRYKGNSPQQMSKYGKYPLRESIVIFESR